jgi:drug/metabolite transporter (DMT)-like permease
MGFSLMVLTSFLFTLMSALIKGLGEGFPPMQVVFLRSLFALPILWAVARAARQPLVSRDKKNILLRSFTGLLAMYFYFYALPRMPLALCSFLYNTQPLFVAAFAPAMLGERASRRTKAAMGLGIAGLLLIAKPGVSFGWAAASMVIAAVFGALAHIYIRRLGRQEHPLTVVFDFTVLLTLGAGLASAPGFVPPRGGQWAAILAISALAAAGQLTMTMAYRLEEAPLVASAGYSGIVFATLFDWLVWGKVADGWAWGGGILIIAGGIQLVWKPLKKLLLEYY